MSTRAFGMALSRLPGPQMTASAQSSFWKCSASVPWKREGVIAPVDPLEIKELPAPRGPTVEPHILRVEGPRQRMRRPAADMTTIGGQHVLAERESMDGRGSSIAAPP